MKATHWETSGGLGETLRKCNLDLSDQATPIHPPKTEYLHTCTKSSGAIDATLINSESTSSSPTSSQRKETHKAEATKQDSPVHSSPVPQSKKRPKCRHLVLLDTTHKRRKKFKLFREETLPFSTSSITNVPLREPLCDDDCESEPDQIKSAVQSLNKCLKQEMKKHLKGTLVVTNHLKYSKAFTSE